MSEREAFEEKMCHKLVGVFDNDLNCYDELTDQLMWEAWQASANRKGYKLVPVEPTEEMIDAGVEESDVD